MTIAMAKRSFHSIADDDTPKGVSIPDSWAGIFMWALGRHGPIVLFVVATWFLYQDNKASQAAILEVAKAQIAINTQVASALTAITEEARRAHVRP